MVYKQAMGIAVPGWDELYFGFGYLSESIAATFAACSAPLSLLSLPM
jgi:hypothetical protein